MPQELKPSNNFYQIVDYLLRFTYNQRCEVLDFNSVHHILSNITNVKAPYGTMFGIDNIFASPKVWPHLDQFYF
jgi:hypothetical protein